MRTTIQIDDHILSELKQLAALSNTTLSNIVETAARDLLSKRQNKGRKSQVKLVTFKGNGLQPGVDLDDSSALLDRMAGE